MKPKRRRFRTILLILLLVFVGIQFIPVDRSVPAVDPSQDLIQTLNPPAQVASLIRDACYDCHSHETEHPWYAYISPASQWLQGHVNGARKQVNFSVWGTYDAERKDHALEEIDEVLKEKSMPLKSFTWLHSEAKLTDEERQEMVAWFDGQRR
jgi:uncharacterized membrane protein